MEDPTHARTATRAYAHFYPALLVLILVMTVPPMQADGSPNDGSTYIYYSPWLSGFAFVIFWPLLVLVLLVVAAVAGTVKAAVPGGIAAVTALIMLMMFIGLFFDRDDAVLTESGSVFVGAGAFAIAIGVAHAIHLIRVRR